MSFSDQYAELEAKFKEQVERDDRDFGLRSRYLPNIAPQGRGRLHLDSDGTFIWRKTRSASIISGTFPPQLRISFFTTASTSTFVREIVPTT